MPDHAPHVGRTTAPVTAETSTMPRTCVILQPSYVPWRGAFDLIRQADVYVHYDDVQYDKNGWRNRNRIKGANGSFWLTIPVTLPDGNKATRLDDARISYRQRWRAKHWSAIRGSYRRAPHFAALAAWLEAHFETEHERLIDFTIPLLEDCASHLGLSDTEFVRSSRLAIEGERSERLVEICRVVGADRYVSGPSARAYLDVAAFETAGIEVEFATYDHYAPYEQLHGAFDPQVSIIDTFAMLGPDALSSLEGRSAP